MPLPEDQLEQLYESIKVASIVALVPPAFMLILGSSVGVQGLSVSGPWRDGAMAKKAGGRQ
jgi:hypothetical protein